MIVGYTSKYDSHAAKLGWIMQISKLSSLKDRDHQEGIGGLSELWFDSL